MLAVINFVLEHFYYGQFVRDGRPEGELRLLASSAGVQPEQVAEAVQQALIPPLVESPTGSWALVRSGSRTCPVPAWVDSSSSTRFRKSASPPQARSR